MDFVAPSIIPNAKARFPQQIFIWKNINKYKLVLRHDKNGQFFLVVSCQKSR